MNIVQKSWLRAVRNLLRRQRRPLARRTRPRLFLEHLETRLTPSGAITSIAGNGNVGYGGDNGPSTAAMLYSPSATAVDSSGNVFIADTNNNRIREVVKATGNIITVAGSGGTFYNGDNIPATVANIGQPHGIAVDASGNDLAASSPCDRTPTPGLQSHPDRAGTPVPYSPPAPRVPAGAGSDVPPLSSTRSP